MDKVHNHSGVHYSRKKRKIVRHIISMVLSFLLGVCMTILLFLIGCKAGLFNTDVLMGQLNKTNYYMHISDAIEENVQDIIIPSGLPKSILEGVIDEEKVYLDTKNSIEAQLEGKSYVINTEDTEKVFRENIEKYIKTNNIESSSNVSDGVDALVKEINNEYIRLIEFPFIGYYVKYQQIYNKAFNIVVPMLAIIIIVICIVLIKMQHWAHRGIRYIGYGTMSSVLMIGCIPLAILISRAYERINISPDYMYNLMLGIIKWDVSIFLYLALGGIVMFVIELIAIKILKQRVTK